jgi:flagellar basal body-associated protein FliL
MSWALCLVIIGVIIVVALLIGCLIGLRYYRSKKRVSQPELTPPNSVKPKLSRSSSSPPNKSRKATKSSQGETECRRVLEKLYHRKFPNVRPEWLINPETGRRLEVDCICLDKDFPYKFGVEYDGEGHYKPSYNQTQEEFEAQVHRDRIKDELLKKLGYKLIRVPYTVHIKDIEGYLITELKRHNIPIRQV